MLPMFEGGEGEVKLIRRFCQMMVFKFSLQAMSNLKMEVVRS